MKKFRQDRKTWFRVFKRIIKFRYPKTTFVYLGEPVTNGSIILSNHEGTDAPMSLEFYAQFPVRFWGANEMNQGLGKLYKYQSEVYYHQKKHWSLFGAKAFCLIASPLTYLFYRGLKVISIWHNAELIKTINESVLAMQAGENIVIFPEKSSNGYQEELEGFYAGFVVLAEMMARKGKDVDVFVSYFVKKKKLYVVGKPYKYSQLKEQFDDRQQIADYLLQQCNQLRFVDQQGNLVATEQEQ